MRRFYGVYLAVFCLAAVFLMHALRAPEEGLGRPAPELRGEQAPAVALGTAATAAPARTALPISALEEPNAPAPPASPAPAAARLGGTAARSAPAPPAPAAHSRWSLPGQCSADGPVLQARRRLLESFRPDHAHGVEALVAPSVALGTFLAVAQELRWVTDATASLAQHPISTPPLVIYASLGDLRAHACVQAAAIAYYDGALHVSADTDAETLRQNLQHEIVHHALRERGVQAPFWLHEGLAMLNAREIWWAERQYGLLSWGLRYHYPFDRMINAPPRSQSTEAALAVYFQSVMMVQAVVDHGNYGQIWRLVDALARNDVAAEQAFAWGLQSNDLTQQEALWRSTVRAITQAAVGPGYTVD